MFQVPALIGSESYADLWFDFIAHCCLFEGLTYQTVTL